MKTIKATILEALVSYYVMVITKNPEMRTRARRYLERDLRAMPVEDRREYYAIVGRGG